MDFKLSLSGFFLILFSTFSIGSTTVTIVDQDNKPVVNAVVSIADDSVEVDQNQIAVMDQVDKKFLPYVLIVNKGQQVRFPNSDNIRHHVYSFSAIKPFEIRLYQGSTEAPILYDKAGIGVLGCNIHDNMVGYIYVADNEQAKVTDENGQVVLDKAEVSKVMVWHPDLGVGSSNKQDLNLQAKDGSQLGQVSLNKVEVKKEQNTFRSRKFGQ